MASGGRRIGAGRRRLPTNLKIVRGTFRDDRHGDEVPVNDATPVKWPSPPKHLSPEERKIWRELRRYCGEWTAPSDKLTVHGVVSLYDRLVQTQKLRIQFNAPVMGLQVQKTDDQGNPTKVEFTESAFIVQEMKLWKELRAFLQLMGLTPSDRVRMKIANPDAPDAPSKLGELISRARRG